MPEQESKYKVITMCHCDERTDDGEPDEDCYDHWEVGIPKPGSHYDEETGHVSIAKDVSGGWRDRADAQMFADAKNASLSK